MVNDKHKSIVFTLFLEVFLIKLFKEREYL